MTAAASYGAFLLTVALTLGVMVLGLNLHWGGAGLFNVGVAGFVGIGAYVSALLTAAPAASRWGGWELPWPIGWAAAMAAAAACALLLGWLTLRLRADYLAITTFGAAITVQLVALNAERLTGGAFGIAFIPRPFAALGAGPAFTFANLALAATAAATAWAVLGRLAASPWGRALRALREDEIATASLGKSPTRLRLQAFAIGAALMGLAGAMQASQFGFIAPENYLPVLTFQAWVMLIVGGAGNTTGALVGAVVVWALWTLSGTALAALLPPDLQARAASLRLVAIGLTLAGVLLLRPRGLIGERTTISRHLR